MLSGRDDVAGEALEAIDVAPRRLPGSEVGGESVGSGGEGLQELLPGSSGGDVLFDGDACFSGVGELVLTTDVFAPEDGERGGTESMAQRWSQVRRVAIWSASLDFEGIGGGGVVPGFEECGDGFVEPGKVAVVGGGDERVEGEVFFVLQDADGVEAAGGFGAGFDVGGVVLLAQTAGSGSRPGPVVAVVEPAALWVEQLREFVDVEEALPVGCGIAAVDGFGEVEAGVAAGDEVAVEVGDVAVGVGEDGVVGGVGFEFDRLAEGFVVCWPWCGCRTG